MKTVVGIFSDGPETKLAVLQKKGKTISVIDLISFGKGLKDELLFQSSKEPEDLVLGEDISVVIGEEESGGEIKEEPILSVILSEYNIGQLKFIPSVSEPHVSYHLLTLFNKASQKELKKMMLEKWIKSQKSSPSIDNINYLNLGNGEYLSIYTNEYFPVLKQLDELAQSWNLRNLKIPYITSADAVIANHVLKNYHLEKEKNYLIIHVGVDSSRMIFIHDNRIKHISDYLSVGVQTYGFHDTIVSKISLEMDIAQFSEIHKIFLCGEVIESTIQLTFYGSFPLADIEVITFDVLDVLRLPEEKRSQLPVYAFAILPALNYLKPDRKAVQKLNLLPKSVQESQKVFKLGLTGYALLALIFIVVVFFTQKYVSNKSKVDNLQNEINNKQLLISENAELVSKVEQLEWRIEAGQRIQQTLDTLIQGAERWTTILKKIQEFQPENKKIWITNIAATMEGVNIQGVGINRHIIPDFSDFLDKSILKNIITQEIREKGVNKFEINLNPEKYGYKGLER